MKYFKQLIFLSLFIIKTSIASEFLCYPVAGVEGTTKLCIKKLFMEQQQQSLLYPLPQQTGECEDADVMTNMVVVYTALQLAQIIDWKVLGYTAKRSFLRLFLRK